MALKKSQLYSSLWSSCDELRGGMDASQYKDYILTLLFMKYVSDKYAGQPDALIEIPEGGSFADIIKLQGDKEIGEKINKIIGKLAKANGLEDVLTKSADFNDDDKLGKGQEMVDRLSKLVGIFEALDFGANRAEGDDLLGDAYEYLMRHFATESGKSKGQFYTPAEVSRVMAKVVGIGPQTSQDQTIYDPTCGSGSLLLKATDESPKGMSIYGQENDLATWALARMNMILHGHPTAELWKGNTLSAPYFKNPEDGLQTFDFAVANPPFSAKAWSHGFNPFHDDFQRFEYGVPPAKNGDYAFLLHLIKSLKSTGKGAIILPHGVLFRANREADIRTEIIKRGLIKGIVGLPPNLFYGTGIAACIIAIDKKNAHTRTGVFMIDASRGFIKDGNKNRLRAQDIHKIVDVFNKQIELPRYSRMVPVSEISSPANDYNLNIARYIDSSEPEDIQDLDAHLRGGIPNRDIDALDRYWTVFPSLRSKLFEASDRPSYSRAKVEAQQVRSTILEHAEFKEYSGKVTKTFHEWKCKDEPLLEALTQESKPKQVIHSSSEDLLEGFSNLPLLDKYDAYQHLMNYWTDVMQDDVYLIVSVGWLDAAKPRPVINNKEKKINETPDLIVKRKKYKMDLIPPNLIVGRYFADEQAIIQLLELKKEEAARELEELIEQHSGEDGALEDLKDEYGSVSKADIQDQLDGLQDEPESKEEKAVLKSCLELIEAEADASKALREAQVTLNAKVLAQYDQLAEGEIKTLVVGDKWFASLRAAIGAELQRLAQGLTDRVTELEERYAETLPDLKRNVNRCEERVETQLKKMGLVWA